MELENLSTKTTQAGGEFQSADTQRPTSVGLYPTANPRPFFDMNRMVFVLLSAIWVKLSKRLLIFIRQSFKAIPFPIWAFWFQVAAPVNFTLFLTYENCGYVKGTSKFNPVYPHCSRLIELRHLVQGGRKPLCIKKKTQTARRTRLGYTTFDFICMG